MTPPLHWSFFSCSQNNCILTNPVMLLPWFFCSVSTIVFQLLSQVWLSVTPWTAAHQASLSFTISLSFLGGFLPYPPCPSLSSLSHYLSEFAQTHVHWISDAIQHLILCHPFLLLPSNFPSIRDFSNESALCISWPKYWSFSISSSNEYSGLISFRIEWFDLLAVQGVLESFFSNTVWRHQFNTMIFNKVNIFSFLKNVLQSAPKISDLYGHFPIHWLYLMTPLSRNVTVP